MTDLFLDDQSNDVQSVAVKCLAIIIKKVQLNQLGEVCKKLCSLILDGKDALRDIYSIGLKTLIADVPESAGPVVSDRITNKLLSGIRSGSEETKRECLDILCELLKRFGHVNEKDHNDLLVALVEQLDHEKPIIRKRASNCLGALAVVSNDALLNSLVQTMLAKIEQSEKRSAGSATRTYIQTIGTVSRTVGHRLGKHLDRIVPLFLRFCGDPDDENQQSDAINELRENCFPGLESFVSRCPREVTPFLPEILRVSAAFMKYDPNYAYDESEDNLVDMACDDDAAAGSEDNEFDNDDDMGGFSDDDDTSWKVRKAAVRVINAVVVSRSEMLHFLYDNHGDEILGRFKEREENVRLDIIHCFTLLVQATCVNPAASVAHSHALPGPPQLVRQKSVTKDLESKIQSIVSVSCAQLLGQSVKTKSAIFNLLRCLMTSLNVRRLSCLAICDDGFAGRFGQIRRSPHQFIRKMLDREEPNAEAGRHAVHSNGSRLPPS